MNQILFVDDKKRKSSINIKSIIMFFATTIIVFGLIMVVDGSYGVYAYNKDQEKNNGIFGDIKVQIDFLKLENKNLENQIVLSRGKSQFETFSLKKQNPEIIIPVSVKMPKNAWQR